MRSGAVPPLMRSPQRTLNPMQIPVVILLLYITKLTDAFAVVIRPKQSITELLSRLSSSREWPTVSLGLVHHVRLPRRVNLATRTATALRESLDSKIQSKSDDKSAITDAYTKKGARGSPLRTIAHVEKFARLPVWPAWNGALIFLLSRLFGQDVAAKIEDSIGGRVCPNFYNPPERTSPFIMLVHHRHSFAPWDPIRYFQRAFILPEGFPAHPHRGFITVTYILKGGFVHRDSLGVKQTYGAEKRHGGKHTQWLHTGAGMLHEEMFDIEPDGGGIPFLQPSSQELYQLWLNVPSAEKMTPPEVQLLGGATETPKVLENGTSTIIIAGQYNGAAGAVETKSDVTILHVRMEPGSQWSHRLRESHRTGIIYMRRGSISVGETIVPTHHTAYMGPFGSELIVIASDKDEADFLLLAGEPLNERISAQGSMVMNYPNEINQAYADYQMGKMGLPWDHKLSDEEWMEHTRRHPSQYK